MQVLVAPNKKAEKNIPSAPGLLLYRPNKETLLVQGNKDWKEIAMENKVVCGLGVTDRKCSVLNILLIESFE